MAINARATIGRDLRRAVWAKTGGRCWYCGFVLKPNGEGSRRQPNIDHQHPHSLGGEDTLENLVIACGWCNSKKRDCTVEEYRDLLRRTDLVEETQGLIEGVKRFDHWERGELHEELILNLNSFLNYLRTRSIVFHAELLEGYAPDYCI